MYKVLVLRIENGRTRLICGDDRRGVLHSGRVRKAQVDDVAVHERRAALARSSRVSPRVYPTAQSPGILCWVQGAQRAPWQGQQTGDDIALVSVLMQDSASSPNPERQRSPQWRHTLRSSTSDRPGTAQRARRSAEHTGFGLSGQRQP